MHQVHILLDNSINTIEDSVLGPVFTEEFDIVKGYLDFKQKSWDDINLETVHYRVGSSVPHLCGNRFVMHKAAHETKGYFICFKFKDEEVQTGMSFGAPPKINTYGKRPNK